MDYKELKMIMENCLKEYNFFKKKGNYYYLNDELISVINCQKSYYDNAYYINFAFMVKELHENVDLPLVKECDVMGRFSCYINGQIEHDYKLDLLTDDILINNIRRNYDNVISPVIENGIKKYFELYPNAIFAASLKLKKFIECN